MKRNHPFYSPKTRLARAKSHIDRFQKRIDGFFKKDPKEQVIEPDTDGVHQVHKLRLRKDIPIICVNLATEAMEGMRAVLDQVGYAAAIAGGASNPKQTYFPFADDPAQLERIIKGRCKHLPPEIVAVFRSFKPYQGGNDALWALNKLRQGIHTTLVPFGIIAGGIQIAHMQITGSAQLFAPTWDRATNEIAFMRTVRGADFNYKIGVSVNVALGDIDILKNVPAIDALRAMFTEVKRVVTTTETECKRLGFWK